ncbi:TPA: cobaltochelatase CobT-related protein [Klebsiella variicola]
MKKTPVSEVIKFREAIKNVVSMLISRNIPVIERGETAYVEYNREGEPQLICIPSIPDDASDKFLMAIRGFIDHEVAHILFTVCPKTSNFVWNAVEDTFIERKMGELFKGSKSNLINTQRHVIESVFIPQEARAIAEKSGDQTRMFMEFYLVPVLRAWAGQTQFQDFMMSRWDSIEMPVTLLKKHGIDKMLPNINSTDDSVAVAAKIVRLLLDKSEKSKGPSSEDDKPSPSETSDGGETEETKDETSSSSDGAGDEKDQTSANDGDEGEGEGSKDEVGDQPSEEGSSEEEGDQGDADSENSTEIPPPSSKDTEILSTVELPEGVLDMSMEGAMKKIISEESSEASGYRPYQRTYDFHGKLEKAYDFYRNVKSTKPKDFTMYTSPESYQIHSAHELWFQRKIQPLLADDIVATLAKDLERTIASQNRNQFVPGQRRGRLHGPSLYRLSVNDDRVFRKLEVKRAVNSCVQIIIDMSGSMRDRKIATACAAAYTLAEALARINVKTMITGFTTAAQPIPGKRMFNRTEALFLPIIKGWDVSISNMQVVKNLGAVCSTIPLAENVDGESILSLLQHFQGRPEDKKIMMVLSDGEPAAQGYGLDAHLKAIAGQIEKESNVDLLGIGIMTDAPSYFYKDSICLNNVKDLGATLIKQMQRLLS